jgi:hypothetical protein
MIRPFRLGRRGRSGESVKRSPLCVEPYVRVMGQHLRRYVSRNRHDGLLTCSGLSQFGNCVMAEIVEAQTEKRARDTADISLALVTRAFGPRTFGRNTLVALARPVLKAAELDHLIRKTTWGSKAAFIRTSQNIRQDSLFGPSCP